MAVDSSKQHITIAIVGNPNSGKTSLYNKITGEKELVGNYGGSTLEATTSHCNYKGYELHITDLPGVNALSANTSNESYVRQHLIENKPDIVLNVIAVPNLERNLYLTTELIDMLRLALLDHHFLAVFQALTILSLMLPIEGVYVLIPLFLLHQVFALDQALDSLLLILPMEGV